VVVYSQSGLCFIRQQVLPIGKAPWGIAYVTPYTTLATEQEQEQDGDSVTEPATEANKLDYDSERSFEPRNQTAPTFGATDDRCRLPQSRWRTAQSYRPNTLAHTRYLVHTLIMRLFA